MTPAIPSNPTQLPTPLHLDFSRKLTADELKSLTLEELDARHEAAREKRIQELAAARQEAKHKAPVLSQQDYARQMMQMYDPYVVTMPDGQQFLVPGWIDAQETAEARRGGCMDMASVFRVPGELYGQYRWRPNCKYDTPWRDWPEWSEDDTRTNSGDPLTAEQLSALETEGRVSEMLVEGWLPAAGVNPIVGDSGLGKTPLLLQLAACVAGGKDFMGLPTKRGKVLVCDYENLGLLSTKLREVSRAIGLDFDADVAPRLRFLNSPTADEVFSAARQGKYDLIIVDALRGLCGGQEIDPKVIVPLLTKMSKLQACWVLLHHIRKGDKKNPPPDLQDLTVRVLAWLEEAAGSRAIVNQTSTRFGIVAPKHGADLFIRAFVKGHGEKGPLLLERVYDANDPEQPIGYQIARDWSLLPDNERAAYQKVAGQTLAWRELTALFGKNPATRLLEACRNNHLVTMTGKAHTPDVRYVFRPLVIETEDQATAHALDGD